MERIGRIIHHLAILNRNDSNQRLKEYGLTSNEGSVLMFLSRHSKVYQEELIKELQIDKSAVTRILKTLEDKQLIIKETSQEDKRNHILSLTSNGKMLYPQIKNVIKETTEVMLKDIDQNQQLLLEELLLKMKMNLEDTYEK